MKAHSKDSPHRDNTPNAERARADARKPLTEMAQKRMRERIKATFDAHGMIPCDARHTYITAGMTMHPN